MVIKLYSRDIIKVPKFITCYFCRIRNVLLVLGKAGSKLIKLEVKIFFKPESNIIIVTSDPFHVTEALNTKKKRKGLGTKTKTLIKKAFLDVTRKSYKKLKVVGVGFKVSYLEFEQLKLLKLEIGYSHSVYFRIPNDVFVLVTSSTNFIVSGDSSDRVGEIASKIRKLKLPEVYKGKGILYENEVVLLKKVKKQ